MLLPLDFRIVVEEKQCRAQSRVDSYTVTLQCSTSNLSLRFPRRVEVSEADRIAFMGI